jgi:hypothetical protein
MNTYRAVHLESGRWAVEWSVDGVALANTVGIFYNEAEATFAAYELVRMEWVEAAKIPPPTKTIGPRPPLLAPQPTMGPGQSRSHGVDRKFRGPRRGHVQATLSGHHPSNIPHV